jgi:S1-C subfamily serine protease
MSVRILLIAALALLLAPAGTLAALPSELSDEPLDRGAWRALDGAYRLEADYRVQGVRTALDVSSRFDEPRTVSIVGSAFAVAAGGLVVTADHLVNGRGEALAIAALRADPEARRRLGVDDVDEWVVANAATAVEPRLEAVRLVPATGGLDDARAARVLRREPGADIALLRMDDAVAPALPLDDGQSVGTPVAVIGFGGPDRELAGSTPDVRRGTLARTGTIAGRGERIFTQVAAEIGRGDSGAPVVDAAGRVRGMVFSRAAVGGNIVPAVQIRRLVGSAPLAAPSTAHDAYLEGLDRLWQLDFAAAARALGAADRAAPGQPVIERLVLRAAELQTAPTRITGPDPARGFFRMMAIISALIAILLATGLVRHDMARSPRPRRTTRQGSRA